LLLTIYLFRRSEFLGCLTVPVACALTKNIEGFFLLQPQSYLAFPSLLIPDTESNLATLEETFHNIQDNNNLLKYLELNDFKSNDNSEGRTPFTITRSIIRVPKVPLEFELEWTQPPRIESLLLQTSDLRIGDFIIFIGETNIVAKPQSEIIELLNDQGMLLVLEIFRPIERFDGNPNIIEKLASESTPLSNKNVSSLSLDCLRKRTNSESEITETPKSHKSCSSFKKPKICFQPTIGNGVFV